MKKSRQYIVVTRTQAFVVKATCRGVDSMSNVLLFVDGSGSPVAEFTRSEIICWYEKGVVEE